MPELIDKQAALDIAMSYCPDNDGCYSKAGHDIREMIDEIEALPAIEMEMQHGTTLFEAIGYIKVLCDSVSDQPCGCDACPYGDTVDDDGICDVWKALHKDEVAMTNETDGYTYYEIWNTTSRFDAECTERCVTLKTAKEHLEKNHCDWCRPVGTGVIYGVSLVPVDDGTINLSRTEIYRKR